MYLHRRKQQAIWSLFQHDHARDPRSQHHTCQKYSRAFFAEFDELKNVNRACVTVLPLLHLKLLQFCCNFLRSNVVFASTSGFARFLSLWCVRCKASLQTKSPATDSSKACLLHFSWLKTSSARRFSFDRYFYSLLRFSSRHTRLEYSFLPSSAERHLFWQCHAVIHWVFYRLHSSM